MEQLVLNNTVEDASGLIAEEKANEECLLAYTNFFQLLWNLYVGALNSRLPMDNRMEIDLAG